MTLVRCSLVLFITALVNCFAFMPLQRTVGQGAPPNDDDWKKHPALAEPDGESHRGDKMIAAEIKDPRVLIELSRRFREAKPLRIVEKDGKEVVVGAKDFEKRQEYLLRLLDYYWFSKQRLVGMTRVEVEQIFGPLGADPERVFIFAGRDTFCIRFKDRRVSEAFYSMGY
jgi:hypothetical protein